MTSKKPRRRKRKGEFACLGNYVDTLKRSLHAHVDGQPLPVDANVTVSEEKYRRGVLDAALAEKARYVAELRLFIGRHLDRLDNALATLRTYRELKASEGDHHGVQDAASDMRDLEAEQKGLRLVLAYLPTPEQGVGGHVSSARSAAWFASPTGVMTATEAARFYRPEQPADRPAVPRETGGGRRRTSGAHNRRPAAGVAAAGSRAPSRTPAPGRRTKPKRGR